MDGRWDLIVRIETFKFDYINSRDNIFHIHMIKNYVHTCKSKYIYIYICTLVYVLYYMLCVFFMHLHSPPCDLYIIIKYSYIIILIHNVWIMVVLIRSNCLCFFPIKTKIIIFQKASVKIFTLELFDPHYGRSYNVFCFDPNISQHLQYNCIHWNASKLSN